MPGFFDKMKSTISEKGMEATIRAREAVEAQQINSKIGDLENQKKKALLEIGEAVYAMYQSSAFDQEALGQKCEAISGIDGQIREKQAELEEVHRRAEAQIAEHKASVAAAGAASSGSATTGATFCPNCGTATQGAKFCPSCGTKIA